MKKQPTKEPGRQLTKDAFYAQWLELVGTGLGSMMAYNKLEAWHKNTFGQTRYSSYYSFRQVRDR